jgi:transposase InsO family protein
VFTPRPNVPDQHYCSKPECQQARRRRWQRRKLREDPDYRANQAVAQRRWRERHPDYWRRYRQSHPAYAARNRAQQRQRNGLRKRAAPEPSPPAFARMDACERQTLFASGTYQLIPVEGPRLAKMDAYLVEMRVLSVG